MRSERGTVFCHPEFGRIAAGQGGDQAALAFEAALDGVAGRLLLRIGPSDRLLQRPPPFARIHAALALGFLAPDLVGKRFRHGHDARMIPALMIVNRKDGSAWNRAPPRFINRPEMKCRGFVGWPFWSARA